MAKTLNDPRDVPYSRRKAHSMRHGEGDLRAKRLSARFFRADTLLSDATLDWQRINKQLPR
jgi:hypothetical protein